MPKSLNRFSPIFPVILFSVYLIIGASLHPLWGDEAETALFARNILSFKIPKGWDGTNLMGYNDAVALNGNLVDYTNPWLQYYLEAVSFKLLGESSFSARLPFVLVSVLGMIVFWLFIRELTGNYRTALKALWALSLSVPFILFSYQARYYSLTVFSGLLFLLSSLKLNRNSLKPKIIFILSGALFIYGQYLSFILFYPSALLAFIIYFLLKGNTGAELKKFITLYLLLGMITGLMFAPWYLKYRPDLGRSFIIGTLPVSERISALLAVFLQSLRQFNTYNLFPVLFIPPGFLYLYLNRKKPSGLSPFIFLIVLVLSEIFLASLLRVFFISDNPPTVIRYNLVIIPLLISSVIILIDGLLKKNRLISFSVILLFIFTDIFTLTRPGILLADYIGEILHPYPSPDSEVAGFLSRVAKPGDTAFVSLDRDHDPLIFFLGTKIRFVNRVSPLNPRLFPANYSLLPKYIYNFAGKPDWIILYGKRGKPADPQDYLTFDYRDYRTLGSIDLSKDYRETVLPVFFSDTTRPELDFRSFTKIIPAYNDQIFIYGKIN